jgi:hypothetical protein
MTTLSETVNGVGVPPLPYGTAAASLRPEGVVPESDGTPIECGAPTLACELTLEGWELCFFAALA